jgi:SHS2 domain-containing protein
VRAGSRERLYARAALAVVAQVGEAHAGGREVEVTIAVRGTDAADLLVEFCNRALLEAEVRHALWTEADVRRLDAHGIEATLAGPRRDPARHVFLREIKAVSFHEAEVEPEGRGWRCRLVLDV